MSYVGRTMLFSTIVLYARISQENASRQKDNALTRILIIRHGQTEWNRVERFRGRADLNLDEVGLQQAEAAARRVAGWPVSAIYASPMHRTLQTAQALGQRINLTVKPLPGIIDIDFGSWQGLSPEEVAVKDSTMYTQWLENPQQVRFSGGESMEQVRERASATLDDLILRHPEQTIALVSHKVVCKILILTLLGLDNSHFWQVEQDVAAINLFEVRNGIPVVLLLNDTCHLKDL